jgi:two-component system, OmpR family, response regulator
MLVLSRRPNEKLVFPTVPASVQVVSIKPGVVRLGVEAPANVPVFREEVMERMPAEQTRSFPLPWEAELKELTHSIRNRLNGVSLGVALLRQQLKNGMTLDCQRTLEKIEQEFRAVRDCVDKSSEWRKGQSAASHPCKALVVEDDTNERELLAGFLRLAGVDVATAGDGSDALDYLHEQGRPDVVLLDMVLPRCDGPTTVREIRRDPALANVKIFAVTGHPRERFQMEQGGVDRWFHKPLDAEALLRDIRQEFRGRRS